MFFASYFHTWSQPHTCVYTDGRKNQHQHHSSTNAATVLKNHTHTHTHTHNYKYVVNYYYLLLESFSHQRYLMVFHWSLSDSKSPQVSRTLLSILAVFNNGVVWMVSTCPLTSKSSSPFNNPFVTEPKAPITIGIITTFMFHSFFFQFPCKFDVLLLLSLLLSSTLSSS